jgi:ElaB/YqjD/DUF883 family membrane-anchored ribosome-binding protein
MAGDAQSRLICGIMARVLFIICGIDRGREASSTTEETHMDTAKPSNTTFSSNNPSPAGNTVNKAAQSAHEIVDKVASLAGEAADRAIPAAQQFAHKAVEKAEAGAAPAAEWLDEHADQLKDAQEKLFEDTRNYVRDNPLTSIGIAFVAGILLSRIVR